MPGRKIRDATDAHTCLEAAARSGLPRAQWAHAHGVDARSLNAWRVNLERRQQRAGEAPALRLVELVPGPQPIPATRSGIRLLVGAVVVEVDRGFDAATLDRLLDVVAPC